MAMANRNNTTVPVSSDVTSKISTGFLQLQSWTEIKTFSDFASMEDLYGRPLFVLEHLLDSDMTEWLGVFSSLDRAKEAVIAAGLPRDRPVQITMVDCDDNLYGNHTVCPLDEPGNCSEAAAKLKTSQTRA